jgi:hypothetical protein
MANKKYKVLHWLDTGIFPASIMLSVGFRYDEINKLLLKKNAANWKNGIDNDKKLIEDSTWLAMYRELHNPKTNKSIHLFYIIIKDCFDFSD